MVKVRRSHQPRIFNMDLLEESKLNKARELKLKVKGIRPLDSKNLPHERSYSALLRGKAPFSTLISEEELDKRAEAILANIRKNRKKLKKLGELKSPANISPEVLKKKQKLQNIINDKITKLQMIQADRIKNIETTKLKREIKQGLQDGELVRISKGDVIPSKKAVKKYANQEEIDKVFSKKTRRYVIFDTVDQRVISKPTEYEKALKAAQAFSRKHPNRTFQVMPEIGKE